MPIFKTLYLFIFRQKLYKSWCLYIYFIHNTNRYHNNLIPNKTKTIIDFVISDERVHIYN